MAKVSPMENLDKASLKLVRLAMRARKKAHAPYSKYLVGCALIDVKGKIHTGCNVENASYSATMCAERVALFKMVTRGVRESRLIALVVSSEEPCFPCGMCLQVLEELAPKAVVIAVNKRGTLFSRATVAELFPHAFSRKLLES